MVEKSNKRMVRSAPISTKDKSSQKTTTTGKKVKQNRRKNSSPRNATEGKKTKEISRTKQNAHESTSCQWIELKNKERVFRDKETYAVILDQKNTLQMAISLNLTSLDPIIPIFMVMQNSHPMFLRNHPNQNRGSYIFSEVGSGIALSVNDVLFSMLLKDVSENFDVKTIQMIKLPPIVQIWKHDFILKHTSSSVGVNDNDSIKQVVHSAAQIASEYEVSSFVNPESFEQSPLNIYDNDDDDDVVYDDQTSPFLSFDHTSSIVNNKGKKNEVLLSKRKQVSPSIIHNQQQQQHKRQRTTDDVQRGSHQQQSTFSSLAASIGSSFQQQRQHGQVRTNQDDDEQWCIFGSIRLPFHIQKLIDQGYNAYSNLQKLINDNPITDCIHIPDNPKQTFLFDGKQAWFEHLSMWPAISTGKKLYRLTRKPKVLSPAIPENDFEKSVHDDDNNNSNIWHNYSSAFDSNSSSSSSSSTSLVNVDQNALLDFLLSRRTIERPVHLKILEISHIQVSPYICSILKLSYYHKIEQYNNNNNNNNNNNKKLPILHYCFMEVNETEAKFVQEFHDLPDYFFCCTLFTKFTTNSHNNTNNNNNDNQNGSSESSSTKYVLLVVAHVLSENADSEMDFHASRQNVVPLYCIKIEVQ